MFPFPLSLVKHSVRSSAFTPLNWWYLERLLGALGDTSQLTWRGHNSPLSHSLIVSVIFLPIFLSTFHHIFGDTLLPQQETWPFNDHLHQLDGKLQMGTST